MNIELISKYLIYLRQAKKYTQEKLANKLGMSRQAISRWETAQGIPDIDILLKLSKIYQVTINQILEPIITNQIKDFEDMMRVDVALLKTTLSTFAIEDIVKAAMGASPQLNSLLQQIFPDFNFKKERESIDYIKVDEVEKIQAQIVSMINLTLFNTENLDLLRCE